MNPKIAVRLGQWCVIGQQPASGGGSGRMIFTIIRWHREAGLEHRAREGYGMSTKIRKLHFVYFPMYPRGSNVWRRMPDRLTNQLRLM